MESIISDKCLIKKMNNIKYNIKLEKMTNKVNLLKSSAINSISKLGQ